MQIHLYGKIYNLDSQFQFFDWLPPNIISVERLPSSRLSLLKLRKIRVRICFYLLLFLSLPKLSERNSMAFTSLLYPKLWGLISLWLPPIISCPPQFVERRRGIAKNPSGTTKQSRLFALKKRFLAAFRMTDYVFRYWLKAVFALKVANFLLSCASFYIVFVIFLLIFVTFCYVLHRFATFAYNASGR